MAYWSSEPDGCDFAFDLVGVHILSIKKRMMESIENILSAKYKEQGMIASLTCLRLIGERFPKCLSVHFGKKDLESVRASFEQWCSIVKKGVPAKHREGFLATAQKEFELMENLIRGGSPANSVPSHPVSDFPDDHKWTVVESTYDDNAPLIIRRNDTAQAWVAHPELSIRLGFAIPLNKPVLGGLISSDENEQLNAIEDTLSKEFARRRMGVYVLALTSGMMKEFVFQVASANGIAELHETIQKLVKTHEIQCKAVKDPEWSTFKSFAD